MKNINFLPKFQKEKLKREKTFYKVVTGLIIFCLIGGGVYLGLEKYLQICKDRSQIVASRNQKLNAQIAKVKNFPRKELKKYENQNLELEYLLNMDNLNTSNYIKSIEKSELDSIWIDKMTYEDSKIVIDGTSVNALGISAEDRIYDLEKHLQETGLYRKIELISIKDNDGKAPVTPGKHQKQPLRVKKFEYCLYL